MRHTHLMWLIALWFVTSPALALEDERRIFELSLEDLMQTPISGATYTDETRATVPSSVTVFDHLQIEKLGVQTLAQLANLAPGFQVLRSSDASGYSMISSRGRRIGGASGEILLLVDGKRTQDLRLSGVATTLDMSLFNVERVEFIRGPGAALYGSGAMMGVINVITRSGDNEVSANVGNDGNRRVSLVSSAGSIDFHADYSTSEGQDYTLPGTYSRELTDTADPYQVTNLLLKGKYKGLSGAVRYASQEYQKFYVLDEFDPDFSEQNQTLTELSLGYSLTHNHLSSNTMLVCGDADTYLASRFSAPGIFYNFSDPPSDAPMLGTAYYRARKLELVNQSRWDMNADNHFTFGGSAHYFKLVEDETSSNFRFLRGWGAGIQYSADFDFRSNTYDIHKERFYGLFGQWQSQLREQTQLTLGARYDKHPDIDEARVSPRLAWVEKIDDYNRIKILYGEAFRSPSVHELGLKPNLFIRGNPDLKAETVATSEIVWIGNSRQWMWSLGYFHNHFTNPILQEVVPANVQFNVRQYVNSQHDDINGVEGELQWQASHNLMLSANTTLITDTDRRAFRESTELASFTANYTRSRWNLNLSLIYRGDRGTRPDTPDNLDAYWLSYTRIRYEYSPRLQFYFLASNLDDETVYYPAQGAVLPKGVPSRGREVSLGAQWNF